MDGFVMTVRGPISAAQLGRTHGHEHLVAYATPELIAKDIDLALDDIRKVIPDVEEFRDAGGGAIAEMTTVDYGRDASALKKLSEQTGVHIIATAGFNKGVYARRFTEHTDVEHLAKQMIQELTEGLDGTDIRAGVVKFGTSLNRMDPWERKAGEAAARAHLTTGAPIITHTQAGTMAHEQLDLLSQCGVDANRVILSHLDRNPDLDLHRSLIHRGAYLSYDQIPKPKYRTEDSSIELIVALAKEGLHHRIMLGGDFARRQYFAGWGGRPGLAWLFTAFKQKLQLALNEADLDAASVWDELTLRNPARAFAWHAFSS